MVVKTMEMPRVTLKEKMSFDEFLAWCDEDTRAEWVNGEVQMVSPAGDKHQDLADFLLTLLRQFVRHNQLGWIRSAPFLMRLPEVPSGREPDVLFVRTEHLDRVKPTYLDGPADLVIEITSPESIGRDRGDKFIEYERAVLQNTGSLTLSGVAPSFIVWMRRGCIACVNLTRKEFIVRKWSKVSGCGSSGCGRNRCRWKKKCCARFVDRHRGEGVSPFLFGEKECQSLNSFLLFNQQATNLPRLPNSSKVYDAGTSFKRFWGQRAPAKLL